MTDDRALADRVLREARLAGHPAGEYVGQENFMDVSEILALGERARLAPGVRTLDVCCGVGGPGLLLAARTGCDYLGVDRSPDAVALARSRAGPARSIAFAVADVPPLPAGPFDVVLLLETTLAFADKAPLVAAVADVLAPGGRFAFTVEEGLPLTPAERAVMPASDTVWPWPLASLHDDLAAVGLRVTSIEDRTAAHRSRAASLLVAYETRRSSLVAGLGEEPVADLLSAHRTWVRWLGRRRVRKYAVVAARAPVNRAAPSVVRLGRGPAPGG
ncbi:hypothetical protein GCM10009623_17490 [Nocardioides aestuarii]|uniref:SAM-dependent methyltransferase n=1 Tax=Nocardioides aestuarii TaxID=252231 RepID=A0ABW4TMG3_9ACTN